MEKFDFSGWATRNDMQCSDGRIIRRDAFKHNDGMTVPLVWNHDHKDPFRIVGHALLENRPEGVYAYGKFNSTELGQTAKIYVEHGDITQLSIYANQLQQQGPNVLHGAIREVSLVIAGANPGASIQNVIKHSDDGEEVVFDDEARIFTGMDIELHHAEGEAEKDDNKSEKAPDEKTIEDVINSMTEEQKNVFYYMLGRSDAMSHSDSDKDEDKEEDEETETETEPENESENENEEDTEMKHNVFDKEEQQQTSTLNHSDIQAAIADAKRYGSMKDAFLAHGIESTAEMEQNYGIKGADNWLFPEARTLNTPPEFIKRDMGWVSEVMQGTHHTPFSRIKSMFADITEDDARAKGYMKGKLKKEEVFSLLKRTTTPTTIYKKQKMDRDDVIDITDFDVIAWLKSEMRMMLNEEIARAILVGDGRLASSDDKINELNIRPIWTDEELFTIQAPVQVAKGATPDQKAKAFIRTIIKSRKNYKGSGEPALYTTEDVLTDCLLLEDNNGRVIYDSVEKLKNALRVKKIITVPVMEGLTREVEGVTRELMGLIVNLKDYNVGADKGGAVNMFDDFDIDYNQQKYLIETRCSGALIKPYSAIAVELVETAAAAG